MTRLADAITALLADCTTDEAAAAIGESRATTGRWMKDLRDSGDLGLWSARAVERLARYENAFRDLKIRYDAEHFHGTTP